MIRRLKQKLDWNGKEWTAAQIQYEFLEHCIEAARSAHYLTEQEERYTEPLLRTVDAVMTGPRSMPKDIGPLDWTIKQDLISRKLAAERQPNETDLGIAWKAIGSYHTTYPREGGGMQLIRKGIFPGGPTPEELDHGLPLPEDTSSRLRAIALQRLQEGGIEPSKVTWDMIAFNGQTIIFADPYATESEQLDRLLPVA